MTNRRDRAKQILALLRKRYPEARCELDFTTPLELAVAAILAAQCTDKRVNLVTPSLFAKYRTAADWAAVPQETLEQEVKSTGFYRNKAKAIRALAAALQERHGGEVPDDLDTLVKLPGIGRKTANLLLADAFKRPGVIVDTHQIRITARLDLTDHEDATKIESDLRNLLPDSDWTAWSHLGTWHGRYTCVARKPACDQCPLTALCPAARVEIAR